jgi:hypothetical protein
MGGLEGPANPFCLRRDSPSDARHVRSAGCNGCKFVLVCPMDWWCACRTLSGKGEDMGGWSRTRSSDSGRSRKTAVAGERVDARLTGGVAKGMRPQWAPNKRLRGMRWDVALVGVGLDVECDGRARVGRLEGAPTCEPDPASVGAKPHLSKVLHWATVDGSLPSRL